MAWQLLLLLLLGTGRLCKVWGGPICVSHGVRFPAGLQPHALQSPRVPHMVCSDCPKVAVSVGAPFLRKGASSGSCHPPPPGWHPFFPLPPLQCLCFCWSPVSWPWVLRMGTAAQGWGAVGACCYLLHCSLDILLCI